MIKQVSFVDPVGVQLEYPDVSIAKKYHRMKQFYGGTSVALHATRGHQFHCPLYIPPINYIHVHTHTKKKLTITLSPIPDHTANL